MWKLILCMPVFLLLQMLYRRKKLSKKLCLALAAGNLLAMLLLVQEAFAGPDTAITSLDRTAGSETEQACSLEVETPDGTRHRVTIRVPEQGMSAEEAEAAMRDAVRELDAMLPGKNESLAHVEWNLSLPDGFPDSPVQVSWISDSPEILDHNGKIGPAVPAEGAEVLLTAYLSLDSYSDTVSRLITVFPSREEDMFGEKLQVEAERENPDPSDPVFRLPQSFGGDPLLWYRKNEQKGLLLALLTAFAAVAAAIEKGEQEKKRLEKRKQCLLREYPELVSRLQLLLGAGLGLRPALKRLYTDYRSRRRVGRPKWESMEELGRLCYEMENGVTEQDALHRFGERCALPGYRELSLLLIQNQTKGGSRLIELLETEVRTAFETRKRSARAEGEKAGVRLLLPMGMMLVVVMAVILVPALTGL